MMSASNCDCVKGNSFLVALMKYIPVIGTFAMTVHVALLLCGIKSVVGEMLVGFSVSGTLLLYVASVRFNFCLLHKALIIYTAVTQMCIHLQRLNCFGHTLTFFRWVILVIGVLLLALVVDKFIKTKSL